MATGDFEWALARLREGEYVRQKSWHETWLFIYLRAECPNAGNEPRIKMMIDTREDVAETTWVPVQSAILATDWELVETGGQ